MPHDADEADKYESELLKLSQLRESIRIHPVLTAMDESQRKRLTEKYLAGNWRGTLGWKDLAYTAGYRFNTSDGSRVGQHYSFFSAYAHSGYLAIMQLAEMDIAVRKDFVSSALEFAQIILSHLINDLRTLFTNTEEILSQHRYSEKALLDLRETGERRSS